MGPRHRKGHHIKNPNCTLLMECDDEDIIAFQTDLDFKKEYEEILKKLEALKKKDNTEKRTTCTTTSTFTTIDGIDGPVTVTTTSENSNNAKTSSTTNGGKFSRSSGSTNSTRAGKGFPNIKIKPLPQRNQGKEDQNSSIPNVSTLTAAIQSDATIEGDPKLSTTSSSEASQGKTFPSLVVTVKPCLQENNYKSTFNSERTKLDGMVKSLLVLSPSRFTEYLFQQGLILGQQQCHLHITPDRKPVEFKLGMYSGSPKIQHSGGYVWISECCVNRLVSVFKGSLFESAPHPPTVLLKLIYHWACQTSVQNVIQWVKVDNYYIKNFYAFMRCICVAAVAERYGKFGSRHKVVEVGVISLGTTSQDGSQRQVKVEVLGALDMENHLLRLKAVEPPTDCDKNSRKRFLRILSPLTEWVNKNATIVTDFTVDKDVLNSLGYANVIQTPTGSSDPKHTNANIMEYLRKVVPRMFQNTLSLLSRSLIQQFLDELVWRERYGPVPSMAFENIIESLADMTKLQTGESVISLLNKIAANPFNKWTSSYIVSEAATNKSKSSGIVVDLGRKSKLCGPKRMKLNDGSALGVSSNATRLEKKYYGIKEGTGDTGKLWRFDNLKCPHCGKHLSNNLEVVQHLALHLNGSTKLSLEPSSCRYCLKDCQHELDEHIEQNHVRARRLNYCRICELQCSSIGELVKHVSIKHMVKELPYICAICEFRSSSHHVTVDHFHQAHVGVDLCQCPFCMKVLSLKSVGALNIIFQHLQKHETHFREKKCEGCVLTFFSDTMLREHQTQAHQSLDGLPGIKSIGRSNPLSNPYLVTNRDGLTMYAPGRRAPAAKMADTFLIEELGNVNFNRKIKRDRCIDCHGTLGSSGHALRFLHCPKCDYATTCIKTLKLHTIIFHMNKRLEYDIGNPIILKKPMYCNCGYGSASGNKLAHHLVACGGKSAYPGQKVAKKRTGRPKTGKEDIPSMLNVLGLVRKVQSTDEPIPKPKSTPITYYDEPSEDDVDIEGDDSSSVSEDITSTSVQNNMEEGNTNQQDKQDCFAPECVLGDSSNDGQSEENSRELPASVQEPLDKTSFGNKENTEDTVDKLLEPSEKESSEVEAMDTSNDNVEPSTDNVEPSTDNVEPSSSIVEPSPASGSNNLSETTGDSADKDTEVNVNQEETTELGEQQSSLELTNTEAGDDGSSKQTDNVTENKNVEEDKSNEVNSKSVEEPVTNEEIPPELDEDDQQSKNNTTEGLNSGVTQTEENTNKQEESSTVTDTANTDLGENKTTDVPESETGEKMETENTISETPQETQNIGEETLTNKEKDLDGKNVAAEPNPEKEKTTETTREETSDTTVPQSNTPFEDVDQILRDTFQNIHDIKKSNAALDESEKTQNVTSTEHQTVSSTNDGNKTTPNIEIQSKSTEDMFMELVNERDNSMNIAESAENILLDIPTCSDGKTEAEKCDKVQGLDLNAVLGEVDEIERKLAEMEGCV